MKRLEASRTKQQKEATELYFSNDLRRPPFYFETNDPEQKEIFEMERRIFQILENNKLPIPTDRSDEDNPLVRAYCAFLRHNKDLKRNIQNINNYIYHNDLEHRDENLRDLRILHNFKKRRYLDSLKTYLKLQQDHDARYSDLFHEAEVVSIAHGVHSQVRSCTYQHTAIREDGSTTMTHLYRVTIKIMNFFINKLKKAQTQKEKNEIYYLMKLGIILGECHDLKEDHRTIGSDNLFRKTGSSLEPTFHSMGVLGDDGQGKYNMNFFDKNKGIIKRILVALTKPIEKNQREAYLTRQILNGKLQTNLEKYLAIVVKICDREHNTETLSDMEAKKNETGPQRQIRKIKETGEILNISQEIHLSIWSDKDLLDISGGLAQISLNESDRIEHDSVIPTSIIQKTHRELIQTIDLARLEMLNAYIRIQNIKKAA